MFERDRQLLDRDRRLAQVSSEPLPEILIFRGETIILELRRIEELTGIARLLTAQTPGQELESVSLKSFDQVFNLEGDNTFWTVIPMQSPATGKVLLGEQLQFTRLASSEKNPEATNPIKRQLEHVLEVLRQENASMHKAADVLIELHALFDLGLDQMEEEAQLIIDAMDMAVDQVQDIRIQWASTPQSQSFTNALAAAVLMVAFQLGVAAVVGAVIIRALRVHKSLKATKALSDKVKKLDASKAKLKASNALIPGRVREKSRQKFDELRLRDHAKKELELAHEQLRIARFVEQENFNRAGSIKIDAPTTKAAEASVKAAEQNVFTIDEALTKIDASLKQLKRKSADFEPRLVISNAETAEIIRGSGFKPLHPDVSSSATKVTIEIAKALGSNKTKVGAGDNISNPGDSPSSIVRGQMLKHVRATMREINGIRRSIDALLNLSLADDRAVPATLDGYARLINEIIWPAAEVKIYETALRELALDFELSLWAVIYKDLRFRTTTVFFDGFSFDDDDDVEIPNMRLKLDEFKPHMVRYFSVRFAKKLKLKPVHTEDANKNENSTGIFVSGLLDAFRERYDLLEKEGSKQLKQEKSKNQDFKKDETIEPIEDPVQLIQQEQSNQSDPAPDI